MTENNTLDPKKTVAKENIRKRIRHALASKGDNKFSNIDLVSELLDGIQDPVVEFVTNFRAKGGKFVPCTQENFLQTLLVLIERQKYSSLLCVDQSLRAQLSKNGIAHTGFLISDTPANASIVYSDTLVARTGSIVFSQKHTFYPSVKNTATDIIVLAQTQNIVNDFKDVFALQSKKQSNSPIPIIDIFTPIAPKIVDGHEVFSLDSPRIILLLVANN